MSGLAGITLIAVLALGAETPRVGASERIWALFFDGSQVTAAHFGGHGWWSDDAMLGGRRLFSAENPVRMLQDTGLRPSRRTPHIVLANGDVLPGEVVQFLPPSDDGRLPARLLLAPASPLLTADSRGLSVRADRVLGIVSAANDRAPGAPGALVRADGTIMVAATVRWTAEGLKALTKDGIVTVPFRQIVDLDVPKVDVMDAVLEDGLYPPLGPGATIGRLETVDGAVLTYHREMTLVAVSRTPPTRGKDSQTAAYLHLQPNWSFDAILVPVDSIWRQSFRAAGEVPLSLLPATLLKQKAGVHQWPWRRNQNVEGGLLGSGHITVDLGVGTHSYCEIAFQLPPGAQEFTTLLGLDRSVGRGACAACKIYQDQVAGKPLFASGLLRGAEEPIPVGPLRVAAAQRLVLVTEFGDEGRPPDAYPLDIGDHVDWLMPFVTVEATAGDRLRSLQRFVPGWSTWNLDPADAGRVCVAPHWDAGRECWLPIVRLTDGKPLTLTRTVSRVSAANDLLEWVFAHDAKTPPPKFELRLDGARLEPEAEQHQPESPGERPGLNEERPQTTRAANGSSRDPRAGANDSKSEPPRYEIRTVRWGLQAFHGRTPQLLLTISFDKHPAGLRWHRLTLRSATTAAAAAGGR